jgi:biopolymer transport protein ExbD
MPHIKMARKSTDTDMTPFVDIAFLILSFFIMATKFKPAEPVKVETPNSVSSKMLKEENAVLITLDPESKVYLNISAPKDLAKLKMVIEGINKSRNLGLTDAEMEKFKTVPIVGVPFTGLKQLLDLPLKQQEKVGQPGIPVLDTLNNELVWWIDEAKKAFAGGKLIYLIKGDNNSKYPTFEAVINAMRRNEEFKYNLITSQEGAPEGTDLYRELMQGGK